MAQTILSESSSNLTSGAGLDGLSDQNIMTLAGTALGVMTVGGAAFVATLVAPGYVIGGTVATGTLLTGGYYKKTTGSFLPFLKKDKDQTPELAEATAS
jgi:hypothetical protein